MSMEDSSKKICPEDEPYTGKRYNGRFRGKVILNQDPQMKGRFLALVPSVTAHVPSTWVDPSSSLAGTASGVFSVPNMGASVWIEYLNGDPGSPIWTGGYWDDKDILSIPPQSKPFIRPGQVMIRAFTGTTIIIEDTPPGVRIETMDGKKIMVNSAGISIGIGVQGAPAIASGIMIDAAGNITISGPTITLLGKVLIPGP